MNWTLVIIRALAAAVIAAAFGLIFSAIGGGFLFIETLGLEPILAATLVGGIATLLITATLTTPMLKFRDDAATQRVKKRAAKAAVATAQTQATADRAQSATDQATATAAQAQSATDQAARRAATRRATAEQNRADAAEQRVADLEAELETVADVTRQLSFLDDDPMASASASATDFPVQRVEELDDNNGASAGAGALRGTAVDTRADDAASSSSSSESEAEAQPQRRRVMVTVDDREISEAKPPADSDDDTPAAEDPDASAGAQVQARR